MTNWKLYVPTYKRQSPKILKMLDKDENLEMTFVVRKSDYDVGYYDKLKLINRLHFLPIENVHDAGETRAEIMKKAKEEGIKYCIMFDDGLDTLYCENDSSKSISQCLQDCVNRLENDRLKDLCIIYEFYRKSRHYSNMPLTSKYFLENPIQAFIINTELAFKEGLNFKSNSIVGFDDEAFFIDTLKHGLITCSDSSYVIDGVLPGVKKEGGVHEGQFEQTEALRTSKFAKLTLNYTGRMYGVYQTKRYRRTIGLCIPCTQFDMNYFYRTLVEKRKENEEVIKSNFLI